MSGFKAVWETLGIAPTSEEREIKRAYARKLKECRPEVDAQAFQELRAAYETALQLASSGASLPETSDAEPLSGESAAPAEAAETPPHSPDLPAPDSERRAALLAEALQSGDDETLTAALAAVFTGETSLTESELLEQRLIGLLVELERPPVAAIDALEENFAWAERSQRVGHGLPKAVHYLLARRAGYEEWEELQALGRQWRGSIHSILAESPASPDERERAARLLRRSGAERDRLWSLMEEYPYAFRFEIDPDLVQWIAEQLPEPAPAGLFSPTRTDWDRNRLENLHHWPVRRSIYAAMVGVMASGLLTIATPKGVPTELTGAYIVASLFLTPVLEWLRPWLDARLGERGSGVFAAAGLWTMLGLAILSQVAFRFIAYPFWWAATMLAVYLALEEPRTLKRLLADGAAYIVYVVWLVGVVQRPMESPFGYVFFVPLLHFPGAFFLGRLRLGRGRAAFALAAGFALLAVLAQLAPAGGDLRRILLGLSMIGLFLLLRSMKYQLSDLILMPLLIALLAKFLGASYDVHPALMLLYLPLIFVTPYGRARLSEAWRGG